MVGLCGRGQASAFTKMKPLRSEDPAALHIRLLGSFEIATGGGVQVQVEGRKAQAIIAYLAAEPGMRASRDKLVSMLWSGRDDEHARNSLRQSLVSLRRSPEIMS